MTEALLPMPTLETERLILRAWEASDVKSVVAIQTALVVRFMNFDRVVATLLRHD